MNSIKIYNINEVKDINKETLISIDLIYLNEKFIDVNNNSVNIMNIDLFKKENPKFFRRHHLYNFKNVIFRKNNIEIISISSIEQINEDFLFDDYDYKDSDNINDIKDEKCFNFKSKLINFSFEEKSINIKEGFTSN